VTTSQLQARYENAASLVDVVKEVERLWKTGEYDALVELGMIDKVTAYELYESDKSYEQRVRAAQQMHKTLTQPESPRSKMHRQVDFEEFERLKSEATDEDIQRLFVQGDYATLVDLGELTEEDAVALGGYKNNRKVGGWR
jgi:hypothetical protein